MFLVKKPNIATSPNKAYKVGIAYSVVLIWGRKFSYLSIPYYSTIVNLHLTYSVTYFFDQKQQFYGL